jgi:hypothetical protein
MSDVQTYTTQAIKESPIVADYLDRLRVALLERCDSQDTRDHLLSYARAQIELDAELDALPDQEETIRLILSRLGKPEDYAERLRATALPGKQQEEAEEEIQAQRILTPCRVCSHDISLEAHMCPHCGAPFPARKLGPASGYEWKSKTRILGVPLVHVAFGRDKNGKMRVAKGIVAIGQFGIGAITIAQFGVGAIIGIGQFTIAPLALGQFAFGLAAAGQFGIGILYGAGQFATGLLGAAGMAKFTLRP